MSIGIMTWIKIAIIFIIVYPSYYWLMSKLSKYLEKKFFDDV